MKIVFEDWKSKIISEWPVSNKDSIECLFHFLDQDVASYDGRLIINLSTSPRISDDKNASMGLCDTSKPGIVEISLGLGGKSDFKCLEYFLHEWCHFRQFLDYTKNIARPIQQNGDDNLMIDYENGIEKPEVSLTEIKGAYIRAVAYELDCNERLLSLFDMVCLEYNKIETIKGMNAYHMSQLAFFDYKGFYKIDPAEVIYELMPTDLLSVEDLIKQYNKEIFQACF